MKKIITILALTLLVLTMNACSKNSENVNYQELNYDSTGNNQYNKMVVNSIEDISRQTPISDNTTALYSIPGNGVIISTASEKTAIIDESDEIFNYDSLDKDGYYYVNGVNTAVSLFKHRGADNQVASYLEDDTAVKKTITLRNSIYPVTESTSLVTPVNMTGLYAPAGELITIEISEELAALNPKVYIGATSINADVNDIPSTDNYTRMPNRVKELTLSETINYVGSPLGGQIYIQADSEEYKVTISGAVEYTHYIYNETSKEELTRLYESTAPMIDIEIPGYLRINMPKSELIARENEIYTSLNTGVVTNSNEVYKQQAKSQVIDEIIELANNWVMYCELSSYICPEDLYRSNTITTFYDSYTVSGNANVGRGLSTFSIEQGRNILNQENDILSVLDVYNLHFWNNSAFVEQGSSNISSKVLSILATMLYGNYGEYRNLISNNNIYSDAGTTLNILKSETGTTFEIAKYITLIHSFGAQVFIEAITTDVNEDVLKDRLYLQLSLTTKTNMEFYFEEVLGWTITDNHKQDIKALNYDMYLPVASNLQIGSVVNNQNVYNVQTFGLFETEVININESIVVAKDMEFSIEHVTDSDNLTFNNGMYYYHTNKEELDEFCITIKVFNDNYSYTTTLIMGAAVQYSNEIITDVTTTIYKNPDYISVDAVNVDELVVEKSFEASDPTIKYSITSDNAIFVTYAEIYLPETKEYTFNIAGLGDMRVFVGSNYSDLKEVVSYKKESTASSFDATDESRCFSYNATANERITIKVMISSVEYLTYERVEFYLGLVNGSSVSSLSSSYWYGQYTSYSAASTTPETTLYNNTDNISIDDLDESQLDVQTTFSEANAAFQWTVNTGHNGIFVTYAQIYLPETKEYTFTVRGLGDMRIYVGTDVNNLTEVINYKKEGTASEYDITDDSRTFKYNATANKKVIFKVVISSVTYSSNQRAEFYLGYLNSSNEIGSITSGWWKALTDDKEEVSSYYSPYNTKSLYKVQNTINYTTSVDEELNIIYQTGKLDDKFLTTPNSSSQSMDAGSIVIYKYEQLVTANYFVVTSASDVDNVLAFFEIYVSNNGVNWTEAFNGVSNYSSYSCLALNDAHTFQYVKLVFASQYSGDYIDICNFEFQLQCNDLTIIDCPNDFLYTGNVNLVDNNSNLNNNLLEFDGRIKFSFTGTSLLLFSNTSSKYGVIEVTVDNYTYKIDLSDTESYSKEILALSYLEYGTYEVTIKVISGLGNIDFIAI